MNELRERVPALRWQQGFAAQGSGWRYCRCARIMVAKNEIEDLLNATGNGKPAER
jgi:hypothetical protein